MGDSAVLPSLCIGHHINEETFTGDRLLLCILKYFIFSLLFPTEVEKPLRKKKAASQLSFSHRALKKRQVVRKETEESSKMSLYN